MSDQSFRALGVSPEVAGALEQDLRRYWSAPAIREALADAGFTDTTTSVCQHFPAALSYEAALERGVLERYGTSQLMVIGDDEFEAGRRRLDRERPAIAADLRLYATTARR